MTDTSAATDLNDLFDQALARYQAGESAASLIPDFQDICHRAPRMSSAWTCLSWLYLLTQDPANAVKAASRAVKIDTYDAQARVNLALALMESKQKGVREHIEMAQRLIQGSEESQQQLESSFADGLQRQPDWAALQKVQSWIFS
jgi:predicted Zn-dependent protease